MKNLSDEILNKLVDNELNSAEVDELFSLIKRDDKELSKAKAHQMVDDVLKSLEIENAPINTTEKIMTKISDSVLQKKQNNNFFKILMGIFLASIVGILSFIVALSPVRERGSELFNYSFINKTVEFFASFSLPISSSLLLTITSSLTILFLILVVYIFEEYKSFKQKLNSIL